MATQEVAQPVPERFRERAEALLRAELLDAAERGLEWAIIAANECELPKDQTAFDNAMRDIRRIEAAIAKARGEPA